MDRILIVDNVAEHVTSLKLGLEGYGFEVVSTNNASQYLALANTQPTPALILLGIHMPQLNGIRTLRILKADKSMANIPVIMVSVDDSDANVVEAIDAGAHDFVRVPIVYTVLAARIRSAIRLSKTHIELEKTNSLLSVLATRDSLTNCYNRRQFFGLSTREIAKTSRSNSPLALMMIDIDHFKRINDLFGHAAGDEALKKLALRCGKTCRSSDVIGRMGGEEFALCCPDTDQDGAIALAERLRVACETMVIESGNIAFSITISIGVVSISPGEHLDDALKRADLLLYQAKNRGRNRVIYDSFCALQIDDEHVLNLG